MFSSSVLSLAVLGKDLLFDLEDDDKATAAFLASTKSCVGQMAYGLELVVRIDSPSSMKTGGGGGIPSTGFLLAPDVRGANTMMNFLFSILWWCPIPLFVVLANSSGRGRTNLVFVTTFTLCLIHLMTYFCNLFFIMWMGTAIMMASILTTVPACQLLLGRGAKNVCLM